VGISLTVSISEEGVMTNRSRIEIIGRILEAANGGGGCSSKTKIMY